MTELIQSLDPNNPLVLAGACALLCVAGLALSLGLQALGGVLELISGLAAVFMELLSGGPVAWCGCLALVALLVGGGVAAVMLVQGLAACGTPEAINFCALIGR
ncbi:MAG: hypothetical protein OXF44_10780 [Anaerolineaceae bacterium]|nr:hypothetical protein [Anaerolineaceae bacterium]MCY4022935.1 hypothetical protein [Anaerolineaceae bacterium]